MNEDNTDIDNLTKGVINLSLNSTFNRFHDKRTGTILSDLRKIREALISLRKVDEQAQEILLASIKIGILSSHPETYFPSLRTLLTFPSFPSTIQGWYSLYLLFILGDTFEFFHFCTASNVPQYYFHLGLAVVRGNYITYAKLVQEGSRFDKALIVNSPGDLKMRKHILNVVGKSYYKVEIDWLDNLTPQNRWDKQGTMYIIRNMTHKPRSTP